MRRKSPEERIKRQYSLPPEIVRQVRLEAVYVGCFDSSVIERALKFYFCFKDRPDLLEIFGLSMASPQVSNVLKTFGEATASQGDKRDEGFTPFSPPKVSALLEAASPHS